MNRGSQGSGPGDASHGGSPGGGRHGSGPHPGDRSHVDPFAPLRPHVHNALPAVHAAWAAGVLGSHPSLYSRSPLLWNAAFQALGLPAVYAAFDVAPQQLEAFLSACRAAPTLLGFSVTVPYKEQVIPFLDGVDADAEAVGAVNVVVRTPKGQLLGANTDGPAALEVLRRLEGSAPGGDRVRPVLLLGAGGAGRAAGVAIARGMPGRGIVLSNRNPERAEETASVIRRSGAEVRVVPPEELEEVLPEVGAVVNATSVGMSGPLTTAAGVTWLEPFSPLGPADPPLLPSPPTTPGAPGLSLAAPAVPPAAWWERAWPGIVRNLEVSLRRTMRLRPEAVVLDLIYAPPESVLLKHARWTGHAVANGEGVLIAQAVEALLRLCAPLLAAHPGARELVRRAMQGAAGATHTG